MSIDFFDPVEFAKQLNSARAHKDSEVWILNSDLYVPWFSKKLPDMKIEWRRSYDLRAVEPQSLRGYSIGGLVIDHYVGDGDADCDSCELLRLTLDSFELARGHIPRCSVEILANGVSSPNRADYVRRLLRSKPADLSALLPTDWFFGSNIYKPVSSSEIKG